MLSAISLTQHTKRAQWLSARWGHHPRNAFLCQSFYQTPRAVTCVWSMGGNSVTARYRYAIAA